MKCYIWTFSSPGCLSALEPFATEISQASPEREEKYSPQSKFIKFETFKVFDSFNGFYRNHDLS